MDGLFLPMILGYALGAATWPFVLALLRRLRRIGRKRRARHYY